MSRKLILKAVAAGVDCLFCRLNFRCPKRIFRLDVGPVHFSDFDITFPSIGPDSIVFQAGGRLYLLDLASEKPAEVAEVLIGTPPVANLIRESKIFQIPSIMQTGKRYGMCLMNESFLDLVKSAAAVK